MFTRGCSMAVMLLSVLVMTTPGWAFWGDDLPPTAPAESPDRAIEGPLLPGGESRLREPSGVIRRGDEADVVDEIAGPEPAVTEPAGPAEAVPETSAPDESAPLMPDPEPLEPLGAEPVPLTNQPWAATPHDTGCGSGDCGKGCYDCCPAPCGPSGRFWVRGEALVWWTKGMWLPPLVTTSPAGTPQEDAGVLPDAEVLFPLDDVLQNERYGGRLRAGMWLDPCHQKGVEVEYFGLGSESGRYVNAGRPGGRPIIARPFFNINPRLPLAPPADDFDPPAREDSELVSFPDILEGTITVGVHGSLHSVAPHFRFNVCCKNWCWQDPCCPCNVYPGSSRLDFLVGYRYMRLREGVWITEDLTSIDPERPGDFDILDKFDTYNDFHGFELGVVWERHHRCWFVEAAGKIALGNNHQVVDIFGTTVFTAPGAAPVTDTGGLLAQRTNIGRHTRNDFTAIPEVGFTVGYHVTPRLSLTFGYTLLYWGRVLRPGEQIDLDVNPDLLPEERVPFEGALRPRFVFNDTDFWAQGINLGLDYRW